MASSSSSSPELPASHPNISDRFSFKYATHEEVLEDLSSRFILNLPDEELSSVERICFQVEQAHWFYEDFIREENPKFPSLPLKKFSAMLFHACPLLKQWSHDHEQAFNNFMQYKTRVPVCGAIMLNDTWEKCILVKGWKSSSGWGFPKGKINQDEEPHNCAVREVLEETGYDLAGQINPEDVIEMSIKEQKISLFIVGGIPEDFPFKTRTRKEISKIEWYKLMDLPTWKRNKATPGKFYLISPFIGQLKAFINERRRLSQVPRKPPRMQNTPARQDVVDEISRDPHAQESSSQSSSNDNWDPHTPSPEYSYLQHTVVEQSPQAPVGETSIDVIDPHFANLLNSLSLSATAAVNVKSPPVLSDIQQDAAPRTSLTPVPVSDSSSDFPLEDEDWSAHAPRPASDRQPGSRTAIPAPLQQVSCSDPLGRSTKPPSPSLSSLAQSISSHRIQSRPTPTSYSSTSRSTSSTADISPYLSFPLPPPTSGKRLKQIALLESVADQSVRMSPVPARRGAASFPDRNPVVRTGRSHAPFDPRIGHAGSVPPLPIYGSGPLPVTDVLYSTNGTVQPPVPLPHPNGRLPPYGSMQDDPFYVRPWTSNAFHPGQTHPLPHPSSASMHQGQLLAFLSSDSSNSSTLHAGRREVYHPYAPTRAPPAALRGLSVYVSNPPHNPPQSAPAMSPGFTFPPPLAVQRNPHNAQLLSILNAQPSLTADPTKPSYPTGSPTPNVLSAGHPKPVGHR